MRIEMSLLLYLVPGLALAWLRFSQGAGWGDALFRGLFWPGEVLRRCIELGVQALLREAWPPA